MFWTKKDKRGQSENQKIKAKRVCGAKTSESKQTQSNKSCAGESSLDDQSKKSQRIRQDALANAALARANIGEETLDKIAAAMTKMQKSNMAQAKAQIQSADPDRVLDELMATMRDRT